MNSRIILLFGIFTGLTAIGSILLVIGLILNDDVYWDVIDTYSIVIFASSFTMFVITSTGNVKTLFRIFTVLTAVGLALVITGKIAHDAVPWDVINAYSIVIFASSAAVFAIRTARYAKTPQINDHI